MDGSTMGLLSGHDAVTWGGYLMGFWAFVCRLWGMIPQTIKDALTQAIVRLIGAVEKRVTRHIEGNANTTEEGKEGDARK